MAVSADYYVVSCSVLAALHNFKISSSFLGKVFKKVVYFKRENFSPNNKEKGAENSFASLLFFKYMVPCYTRVILAFSVMRCVRAFNIEM